MSTALSGRRWAEAAALVAALGACSADGTGGGPDGAADGGSGGTAAISFAASVHPLLLSKCAGESCHGVSMGPFRPGHAAADPETAYAATQQLGLGQQPVYERILLRASSDDPVRIMPPPYAMPACEGGVGTPGCLTEQELELLEAWIAQGAPP